MISEDLITLAEHGDIKNAESIIDEVIDAVMSFPTVAEEIGVEPSITKLIFERIKLHIPNS